MLDRFNTISKLLPNRKFLIEEAIFSPASKSNSTIAQKSREFSIEPRD